MSEPGARRTGPRPTDAAIVGMGAVFPGAGISAAYWRNMRRGVDAITDVPAGRWDPEIYYDPDGRGPAARPLLLPPGRLRRRLAAFDPGRFGIMPGAVAGAEPDQLLALHAAAAAIDDAGGEERLPADRSVGVILGRGGYLAPGLVRLDQRVRTADQLAAPCASCCPDWATTICGGTDAFQAELGPERPEAAIGLVPNLAAVPDRQPPRPARPGLHRRRRLRVLAARRRRRPSELRPPAGATRPRRRGAPLPRRHAVERLHPARRAQPRASGSAPSTAAPTAS